MGMESDTIFNQLVYTQDTQPNDTRTGVLWNDTSTDPPTLKQYDGSSWTAVVSDREVTLIESQSPTGVSEVTFTTGINSDHNRYVLDLTDVVPANDGDTLTLQVSTDGGSSWKSGASDYEWYAHIINSNSNAKVSGSGDSSIPLVGTGNGVGSAAGQGMSGLFYISHPSNGSLFPLIHGESDYVRSNNDDASMWDMVSKYNTAEAIDAIRIAFSGNWESGNAELRGMH